MKSCSSEDVKERRLARLGVAAGVLLALQIILTIPTQAQAAELPLSYQAQLNSLPASYQIKGVPLYAQWHTLSCEYASARMVTAFWGNEISEQQFIDGIGFNDNPHRGFRGNIDGNGGWINDYGIYAEPIANYLRTQGFNTWVFYADANALKQQIIQGRPVIVWVTIALMYSTPIVKQMDGTTVKLTPGEHAVVITGYDEGGVYLNGPGQGIRTYFDWADFERTWGYFDHMALSIWK